MAPNARTPRLPLALWFMPTASGWAAALHFRFPEHAAGLLGRHEGDVAVGLKLDHAGSEHKGD